MALRITAEKVDKELRDYKSEKNIFQVWKSGREINVCNKLQVLTQDILLDGHEEWLIQWNRPWIAVYIETDK